MNFLLVFTHPFPLNYTVAVVRKNDNITIKQFYSVYVITFSGNDACLVCGDDFYSRLVASPFPSLLCTDRQERTNHLMPTIRLSFWDKNKSADDVRHSLLLMFIFHRTIG